MQKIAILGIPYDLGSSFLRGPAEAPKSIRQALFSPAGNLAAENGFDLGLEDNWFDGGDLTFDEAAPIESTLETIESTIANRLAQDTAVLSLGGDHSISHPILRAYGKHFPGLQVLQLDAHPDLYDQLDNRRHSHASPFARVMEENLIQRLVQVGIRTMNHHQREQAHHFGVEVIEMRHYGEKPSLPGLSGPLYLSLDLDVLDPAYAPGVSHHEPGGLSVRQVIAMIQNLSGPLVGADIVELNPQRDPTGVTAGVAAKLLKEIIARMAETGLTPDRHSTRPGTDP